jgi:hypothetical protein
VRNRRIVIATDNMALNTTSRNLPARSGSSLLRLRQIDRLFGKASPLFYVAAAVVVASLLLGGGTRGGFLSDAILQLAAIPLLLYSLWKLFEIPLTRQMRVALWFCLALAALPLIQLIPLPPWLWTRLPGREPSAAAYEVLGYATPWMPISVSPGATWLSALSLVPPLAIFVSTLLLSYRERRLLSLVALAIGIVSVFVGLIQVAQGPGSPLRFFQITNPTEAVGFFANRNHYAALIYSLLLLAVAWTVHASTALGARLEKRQYDAMPILAAIGGFTVLVIFLAGEAMARSRAGLALTMVALFGALVLGFANHRGITFRSIATGISSRLNFNRLLSGFSPTKLLVIAVTLAVTFSLQFALYRIQERFTADPADDWRRIFLPVSVKAAKAYMPLGSGVGTFVSVYPLFETPEDTLINTYANRAHNDLVEAWLESGVIGIVLLGIFVSWLLLRSSAVWRNPPPLGASDLDWSLARAATIIIGLLLVHSFVDYPLRTGAMGAIMAFACALLIEPPAYTEARGQSQDAGTRTRRYEREGDPYPTPTVGGVTPRGEEWPKSDVPPSPEDRRWGTDINWPKEWSKSPGSSEDESSS